MPGSENKIRTRVHTGENMVPNTSTTTNQCARTPTNNSVLMVARWYAWQLFFECAKQGVQAQRVQNHAEGASLSHPCLWVWVPLGFR